MRVVAYARCSTIRQQRDGNGIAAQEEAIKRWAKAGGHRVVLWCRDEAVSGTVQAADRPGLVEAIAAITAGRADGLVAQRPDRIGRTLTISETTLGLIWSHGGRVWTVDTGELLRDDPADPLATFARQVMAAAAQLERGLIAARMRAGKDVKRQDGGYCGGRPPYGYRAEGRALVPVPSEQAAIHLALRLQRDGRNLREISEALIAEGHPAKDGGAWHPESLRRVLRRAGR